MVKDAFRRQFLKLFLGFSGFFFTQSAFAPIHPKFTVTFFCKRNSANATYVQAMHQWRDDHALHKITEKYKRLNQLLSLQYFQTETEMQWKYVFTSKQAFMDWNNEVFFTGAFNSLKISPDFSFNMRTEENLAARINSLIS